VWEQHTVRLLGKVRIRVLLSIRSDGRIFGCHTSDCHTVASLAEVGEEDICFGTDDPHTAATWPYSEGSIEKLCAELDEGVASKSLRGNAITLLDLDRV
jgi:predicted TIM-barrel fold metal-dependent hydrolase